MKYRKGFVSNSSASSFLIFGAQIIEEEETAALEAGLAVFYDGSAWDEDVYFAGLSWDSIRDDETGAQFKARVIEAIETFMPKGTFVGIVERAWYDG